MICYTELTCKTDLIKKISIAGTLKYWIIILEAVKNIPDKTARNNPNLQELFSS